MRSPAIALVFAAALVATAQARLGETEAQCLARYGAPDESLAGQREEPLLAGAKEIYYSTGDWRIRTAFINGVAVRVEYTKTKGAQGPRKPSDEEVASILDAEKGKFVWHEQRPTGPGKKRVLVNRAVTQWERSDRATARVMGPRLIVEARDADEQAEKLAKQAAAKKSSTPDPNAAKKPKF